MIEQLISRISKCLDEHSVPYMLIGGQALLLYGIVRSTRDIDITLGIDSDSYSEIVRICEELDLNILPKEPQEFANQTRTLPAEEPNCHIRIDFIFSFTPYERQAIKRAQQKTLAGYPVKFASSEDLIIFKMIAGRAVDIEDVKGILNKKADSIDFEYIYKWLSEFTQIPEYKNIAEQFKNLRNS
jgi:predicted nucleotidyltransferase